LPGVDLLEEHSLEARTATDPSEMQEVQQILIETLAQFGIAVAPGDITKGPTITRYEVYPAKGVRVDKIVSLERDLARATSAERINILAPIPGKDTVGIELANTRKVTVKLRELFQSTDWDTAKEHSRIPLALGKDGLRQDNHRDLAQMPHLLVAGTTGSGKSVCINAADLPACSFASRRKRCAWLSSINHRNANRLFSDPSTIGKKDAARLNTLHSTFLIIDNQSHLSGVKRKSMLAISALIQTLFPLPVVQRQAGAHSAPGRR